MYYISTCCDVHTTYYPEDADNSITRCITRAFQSCMQLGCRKYEESAARPQQMIILSNWLLKYRVQASFIRLLCLTSAVLEARGELSRKQSSEKYVCTL